jgi:DNA polymerase I-like protein with 3'-5' exonuclease and polymerase domains|tara:strand:+ start:531 stop:2378 length:1848 start_codon:yes stop_codon:yes gene_type:complete
MNNIIVIDFETYYDKNYGLRKYTTEGYIRDDQFEVIGVAVKENKNDTVWFTGTHQEIKSFLDQYDFANSFVVGHNMRFDGAILAWHFDIHPKGLMDTMGMGQILHGLTESVSLKNMAILYNIGQKGTEVLDALGKHRADFRPNDLDNYGKYCINDVDLTYHLFYAMLNKFTATEFKLIDLTIRMFTEPTILLNKGLLLKHLDKVKKVKQKLLEQSGIDKEDLMSNPKFAEILKKVGVEPPTKISMTTGNETFAFAKTDEGFKALLEHENPAIQIIAAARVGNKSTIEETRTENFIHIANRGLLPVPLKYAGAVVSHRWSGVDGINLQNLPRSSELRKAMCAPEGYKIVASDLSNIELRLAFWFARAENKLDDIRNGVDLYKQSASQIMNIGYDEVNKDLRFIFKVVNLSGIYGVGPAKMHSILKQGGVDRDINEVKNIVYAYRDSNPELLRAWEDAGEMLNAIRAGQSFQMGNGNIIQSVVDKVEGMHGMKKPNGMILQLPNLRQIKNNEGRDSWVYDKKLGRSLLPEYIHPAKVFQRCIQSLARDIIGDHLISVSKKYKVVMTVHDELVMVCRDEEVEDCVSYVEQCMTTAPEWCPDLPLGCEVGVGDNYMDAK